MDKELIVRNSIEVVTDSDLDMVLQKKDPVVYCGYETSGPVHIGHMVTVTKLLDFMNAGFKVKVLFADIHTKLNRKGSGEWVDAMVEYWERCFSAMGLSDAEFVKGSSFQFEKGYIEDVLSLSLSITMKRALRSMQEVARDIDNARVSQMIYPLMQIVDIKALNADVAYGGLEQRKIHMLAREALPDLGFRKPVCLHTPLLCSLKGPESKMSSSDPTSIIGIDESAKSTVQKVSKAYCPPETENNPVLDIAKLLIYPRVDEIAVKRPEKFGGDITFTSYDMLEKAYEDGSLHAADLKSGVGNALADILTPIAKDLEGIEMPQAK